MPFQNVFWQQCSLKVHESCFVPPTKLPPAVPPSHLSFSPGPRFGLIASEIPSLSPHRPSCRNYSQCPSMQSVGPEMPQINAVCTTSSRCY